MKKCISIVFVIMFCLVVIIQSNVLDIYAAASVSIKTTPSSVKIGDTITVTVTFSGNSIKIGQVDAFMTFDNNIIEYIDGDNTNCPTPGKVLIVVWDTSGKGKDTLSVSVRFKAKKAGSSPLKVTSTALSDINDVQLSNVTASSTVKVNTASTPSSSPSTPPPSTPRPSTPRPSTPPPSPTKTQTETTTEITTQTPTETPTITPTITPTETPTQTSTETPTTIVPSDTAIQDTAALGNDTESGMFSTKTAFIICAVGMFIMGGACGFIPAYIIKSKK